MMKPEVAATSEMHTIRAQKAAGSGGSGVTLTSAVR